MRSITVKFGGKVWENVPANNSGWIAPGAPNDLVEALKKAPRAGYTSKGCPIVKSDEGTNIYLGAAELHTGENEAIHQTSGSGSGTSARVSAIPEDVARKTLALKGLPEDVKAYFQGIVAEYDAQKAKKVDAAVAALVAIGYSEEEAKKLAKK